MWCLCAPLLVVACHDDPTNGTADELTIDVEVSSAISTVARVGWSSDLCPEGDATFTLSPDDGLVLPASGGSGDDRPLLFGLHAATDYVLAVDVTDADGACVSGEATFSTGGRPSSLPDLYQELGEDVAGLDGFILSSFISNGGTAAVLDLDGNVVWWHEDDLEDTLVTSVQMSRDRSTIYYNSFDWGASAASIGYNRLVAVSLDGYGVERTDLTGLHHDFVELPDGTIAYLSNVEFFVDGFELRTFTDNIVEWKPGSDPVTVWEALDDFPFDPDDPVMAVEEGLIEWSHANALRYSEEEDAYYVSLRNRNAIARVPRSTGRADWIFGGLRSTVDLTEGGSMPDTQHRFTRVGDKLLVFDNGDDPDMGSRVAEYEIHSSETLASQTLELRHDPSDYVFALGDAHYLPDDFILVSWATMGKFGIYSRDGTPAWELSTDVGAGVGYVSWLDLPTLEGY